MLPVIPPSRAALRYFGLRAVLSHAYTFEHSAPRVPYWRSIPRWANVSEETFLSYSWQTKNSVQNVSQLSHFLHEVLPDHLAGHPNDGLKPLARAVTADHFIEDVQEGLRQAPMSVRLTPHILSCIDWHRPYHDPIRRQFIALGSTMQPDHPNLSFDSLHESDDSPVKGLVHRYPDKVLFLATSVCPVYCRFCTRSYAVGSETEAASKTRFLPITKKWEPMFAYIARTPEVHDVVVSGGDVLTLEPGQVDLIGRRLLSIPHVRRIRFASKGVAVCPSRIVDPDDQWSEALIVLSKLAREMGKTVALHTHFNHPSEITWVTRMAADKLFREGVTVRNQTVLLKGVNNDVETMSELIQMLAELNIQPYYVYQGDMVRGLEDLRTPLHEILHLENRIRGTIAGFLMPNFVVDLPGGGGKRLACSYENYDRMSGVATYRAPGVKGDHEFHYWDPILANSMSTPRACTE